MFIAKYEENEKLAEATGRPPSWRIVCHTCGYRGPIHQGRVGSGGASAMRCCRNPQPHFHDLRVPCDTCSEEERG